MPWNWERVQLEEMAVVGALDYLSDKKRKKKKKELPGRAGGRALPDAGNTRRMMSLKVCV